MKKIGISLLSVMVWSNVSFAGANFKEVLEPTIIIPTEVDDSVDGFYVGLGLSVASTHESSLDFFSVTDGQDRTGDVGLLAGYDFGKYIGIEARYMVSVAKEDIVDRASWGIYAKPQYPVTEDIKVYGLLGFGGFDLSGINHFGQNINADDVSFQWGLGVSYEVYENISISVDYVQVASDIDTATFVTQNVDVSSDIITLGVTYHF